MNERPYALLLMRQKCRCGSNNVSLDGEKPVRMTLPAEGEDFNEFPTAASVMPGLVARCGVCNDNVLELLHAIPHDPVETDANDYDAGDTTDYPYTGPPDNDGSPM